MNPKKGDDKAKFALLNILIVDLVVTNASVMLIIVLIVDLVLVEDLVRWTMYQLFM